MNPRVFRLGQDEFYVESSSPERKFCYRVVYNDEEQTCTCGDFTMTIQKDPKYRCEHILAVQNSNGDDVDLGPVKPKLDERFIKDIRGRQFVVYAGVLDVAHQKGLRGIEVDAVQFPTQDNGMEAICKATVQSEDGCTFVEWGDANPKNVNSDIAKHILRMAATRAKARALRDFTNIGMTCLEELADLDDVSDEKPRKNPLKFERPGEKGTSKKLGSSKDTVDGSSSSTSPASTEQADDSKQRKNKEAQQDGSPKMSVAQLKAIENLSKRRGLSKEELEELAKQTHGKPLEKLSTTEASALIRSLQQSA